MLDSITSTEGKDKKLFIHKVLSGNKLEWLALILFGALYVFTAIYHEPWFDESQAWQIARCASLREILFEIPHYEGHPAFWYLILLIPARLGLPYEFALKTIGGILIMIAAYIFLFKAPFMRWFKIMVPFTFFFFYQYGIIVRPYSLMLIFMMLAAIFFNERNEKPWRFVFCLIGICLCSAYGLLVSGGIAVAWVVDILKERKIKDTLKSLFTTKRMAALWCLFVSALIIVWQIRPYANTYATAMKQKNSFAERIICSLFVFLPDTFLTETSVTSCEAMLKTAKIFYTELVLVSLLGIAIWFLIWIASDKNIFKYLAIPYTFFAVFVAYSYFTSHHLGIVLFMLLFWGWINENSDNKYCRWKTFVKKLCDRSAKFGSFWNKNYKLLKKTCLFIAFIVVCLSVYWNIQSIILEVQYQFSFGRAAAEFIKDNNLDELVIVSEWIDGNTLLTDEENDEKVVNTYYVHAPINIYPYFDSKPFVVNCQEGYVIHINPTDAENDNKIDNIKEAGTPDVLIGEVDVSLITDGEFRNIDYSPVFTLEMNVIWKGAEHPAYKYIYMRNDLLDEYGLESYYNLIKAE